MKKLFFFAVSLLIFCQLTASAFAGYVNGYTRRDGTEVQGYNRSEPNNTVQDNYSYKGNTNPYTGETGSNLYRSSPSSEYYGTTPSHSSSYGNTSDWNN